MLMKSIFQQAGGGTFLGAFFGLPSPGLVEVIGRAGFSFIILDGEHGSFSVGHLEDCLRAADLVGLPAVVRVPEINAWRIQSALDAGAKGVQVPSVETPDQAREIVAACKFPPDGSRGYGSSTRAAGYGYIPRTSVTKKANLETTVTIQIETQKGVANLKDILKVDDVDSVFVGTSDLSLGLGYSSPSDPAMIPLLTEIASAVKAAGKSCGVHITDWKILPQIMEMGVSYFTVAPLAVMGQSLKELVIDFSKIAKKSDS